MGSRLSTIYRIPLLGGLVVFFVSLVKLPALRREVHRLSQILSEVDVFEAAANANDAAEELQELNSAGLKNLGSSLPPILRLSEARYKSILTKFDQVLQENVYLRNRIEFVRRELMFELRYGARNPISDQSLEVETAIINVAKVERARSENLKVNLGCGHLPLEGFVNVDRRELPGVDIVADIESLPFNQGEVDSFFCAHLLEHFPEEQLMRQLLPYLLGLLKVGGELRAIVPDGDAMSRHYAAGNYEFEDFREVVYGGQDYDGDFHFNMFSPASITKILRTVGFQNVVLIETGRRNGKCFELEVSATK